jgi:hypothetical protein
MAKTLVIIICVFLCNYGVIIIPTLSNANENTNDNGMTILDNNESNGIVERYAIAMGFSFPGIEWDAHALRDILHENYPEIWPLDHIRLYSHDSWSNIVEGLRWIESQEDENDITIWQSAGHGSPEGICTENGFIPYTQLNYEFNRFDGSLLIMICACGSCYAHEKLAGDNRIIITGRTPLNNTECNCKSTTDPSETLPFTLATYFIMHFVYPGYGAWGNELCDQEYGNNDGWVSAEEAFAYVEDSFEWPDEIFNNWCFGHIYMTDSVPGNLNITYINKEIPPEINPPDTPSIEGPVTGEREVLYDYDIVSSDPDDHNISYIINWGDLQEEEIGPLPSGTTFTLTHNWSYYGNYTIQVLAIDECDYESNWAKLNISIPKNKGKSMILNYIHNKFPFFSFLQRLLAYISNDNFSMEVLP